MKDSSSNPLRHSESNLFKNLFSALLIVTGLVLLGSKSDSDSASSLADQQSRVPNHAESKNIEPASFFSPDPIEVSLAADDTDQIGANELPEFKIGEFLKSLKVRSNNYTTPDINDVLNSLHESHADHDMQAVVDWLIESRESVLGVAYHIADQYKAHGDYAEAYRWYQISVRETPSPQVYYQLGEAQLLGRGTATNYTKAKRNLYQSVRNQHPEASYLLGVVYLSGLQTEPNPSLAYQWFQKSMAKGSQQGFTEAARMRELGYGIKQDRDRAIEIYKQGATLGNSYCEQRLNVLGEVDGQTTSISSSDSTSPPVAATSNPYLDLLPEGFLNSPDQ